MPAAFVLTCTLSRRSIAPLSTASQVSSIVMIFVTLATGRFSSAFTAKMIWPLTGSTSSAAAQLYFAGAPLSKGVANSAFAAPGSPSSAQTTQIANRSTHRPTASGARSPPRRRTPPLSSSMATRQPVSVSRHSTTNPFIGARTNAPNAPRSSVSSRRRHSLSASSNTAL